MVSKNSFKICPLCGGTGQISRVEHIWEREPDRIVYETVDILGSHGEMHQRRVPKTIPGRLNLKTQTVYARCPSCNGTGKIQ